IQFPTRRMTPMSRTLLGCLLATSLILALFSLAGADAVAPKEVTPLFNGKDLTNFYTFLKGYGKNSDPKKVFSVVDGVIRVSGEVDGGLITEKDYENYRLVVQYKWGSKTWPPREKWAM